ncbi:GIP, partial [Symbiodinium necroappetens]
MLRRSNPTRGPYAAGSWVLYWTKKSSPNRLAAGKWHGPAKVICQEGQSIVWVAHGSTILRCAPENLRPASLREWQNLSTSGSEELSSRAGGASTFIDLTAPNPEVPSSLSPAPILRSSSETTDVVVPVSMPGAPAAQGSDASELEINQPEQELTPQVSSHEPEAPASLDAPEVELNSAAPSVSVQPTSETVESLAPDATNIPVPESDEGLVSETVLLASHVLDPLSTQDDRLVDFVTLHTSEEFAGPPLAEDNLPFVECPLECQEHQAFCLEVPVKPKDLKKWSQETSPEQLATLASISKRARSEVSVKDLTPHELSLFEQAKAKELQCWIQTSAIRAVLRRRLNPDQILKSRWILTWKAPVMRDAPTLSKEGRSLVLQTIASSKFPLGSFDIKTAFLRGKADENNPLAMEPPKELRKLLNLRDDEVCQLLGNAYGRVDAPLLFYKELSSQLEALGFI